MLGYDRLICLSLASHMLLTDLIVTEILVCGSKWGNFASRSFDSVVIQLSIRINMCAFKNSLVSSILATSVAQAQAQKLNFDFSSNHRSSTPSTLAMSSTAPPSTGGPFPIEGK